MNRIHQKMSLEQKIQTLSPASDEELIKNSYRLAEDMIKVMDTPFKVRVRISPDSSRTDGKAAWVTTEVFDDTDLPLKASKYYRSQQ